MWVAFGLITLLFAFVAHYVWRTQAAWRSESVAHDGAQFDVGYDKTKSGAITGVRAGLRGVPARFHFDLRIEGEFDRFSKSIGLTEEREFRDREFDRAVFVESDDPVLAKILQDDPELRAAVARVFAEGGRGGFTVQRIRCRRGRLWVQGRAASPTPGSMIPHYLARVGPMLRALRGALAGTPSRSRAPDPFVRRAVLLLSVSSASAIFGVVTLFRALGGRTDLIEPLGLLALTLLPSAVLLVAFCVFARRWLGRSARTHLVLAELLIVGGFGFLAGGYGLAREANIDFDTGPAVEHALEDPLTDHVVRRTRKGGRRHSYYLYVPEWPKAFPSRERIQIDAPTYHAVNRSRRATLVLREGALGAPWIEAVRAD